MDTASLHQRMLAIPFSRGFPYLVTRIAASLHHLIVLPSDRSEADLVNLARRQHAANQLRTALVVGADRTLYLYSDEEAWSDFVPRADFQICGVLRPPEEFELTPDLLERQARLEAWCSARRSEGYLVSSAGGRPATFNDRARLQGDGIGGIPNGLVQCRDCRLWKGEALIESRDEVVDVFCRCQNHNLCAWCLEPLNDRRLDGCGYFEADRSVLHVPAFCGLAHVCEIASGAAIRPRWGRLHLLLRTPARAVRPPR